MENLLLDLPEKIESNRLILRVPQAGDGICLYEALQESYEYLSQWIWTNAMPNLEEAEATVRKHRIKFLSRESLPLYLFE